MILSPEAFQSEVDVSHETLERLKIYAALLEQWQAKMNLVGPGSLPDMWRRHFLDSAQLLALVQKARPDLKNPTWVDLGSGAGFPGLVLAIMGAGTGKGKDGGDKDEGGVHLVESNGRKCAFLRQVIRETGAAATVHNCRIEALADLKPGLRPDVITSRALASVEKILELSENLIEPNTEIWLLKSQYIETELTQATISWGVEAETYPSRSDPSGVILRLKGIQRVKNNK